MKLHLNKILVNWQNVKVDKHTRGFCFDILTRGIIYLDRYIDKMNVQSNRILLFTGHINKNHKQTAMFYIIISFIYLYVYLYLYLEA